MILTKAGFSVEKADNGKIAVEMVAGSGPGYYDAILMDTQMPVMDGYAAAKEIRSISSKALADTPILAVTANAFQENVQAAANAGMQAHIATPIDINTLIDTLKTVLKEFPALYETRAYGPGLSLLLRILFPCPWKSIRIARSLRCMRLFRSSMIRAQLFQKHFRSGNSYFCFRNRILRDVASSISSQSLCSCFLCLHSFSEQLLQRRYSFVLSENRSGCR